MKKFFLLLGFFLLPIHSLFASDAEIDKLQWHLNRVEGILRKVDTSNLTEEQKVNRTKMLDRLHSYTIAGKFPNNDTFPGKSVPFFRGSNGNLCAVGYLMDADPDYKTFIENIVKSNNNVELMDVQTDPTVNAWAKKYGFSILELAMIQPTYEHMYIGYPPPKCQYFFQPDCSTSEQWDTLIRLIQDILVQLIPSILVILGSLLLIFIIFVVLVSYHYFIKKDSVRAIQYYRYILKLLFAIIIVVFLLLIFYFKGFI